MRLLTRYILKQLLMPFVFSLLIIVFVLFTQFLLRAIDRFIGKGLDLGISANSVAGAGRRAPGAGRPPRCGNK